MAVELAVVEQAVGVTRVPFAAYGLNERYRSVFGFKRTTSITTGYSRVSEAATVLGSTERHVGIWCSTASVVSSVALLDTVIVVSDSKSWRGNGRAGQGGEDDSVLHFENCNYLLRINGIERVTV